MWVTMATMATFSMTFLFFVAGFLNTLEKERGWITATFSPTCCLLLLLCFLVQWRRKKSKCYLSDVVDAFLKMWRGGERDG